MAREVRRGHLFCARIHGQELVRGPGWVLTLTRNRVPRAVQEMMKMFERIRSGLKLSPGVPAPAGRHSPPPLPADGTDGS